MSQTNAHTPVLIDSIIEFIKGTVEYRDAQITKSIVEIYDATFGGGGYTKQFLTLGKVVAVDADCSAIEVGRKIFERYLLDDKLKLECVRFDAGLARCADEQFDYIIADLGFSSNQLESSGRGFSYLRRDEPLDLRYNTDEPVPCYSKLNSVKDVDKLRKVIYNYSGESHSKRIAQLLFDLNEEKTEKSETIKVGDVVDTITSIIPPKEKKHTNAILSRVWQALRIWTNNEFLVLEKFLEESVAKIKPGGYIMVVCFHSLEDKIVTKYMRALAKPRDADDYGNKLALFELHTKKAIIASDDEITINPRSRSATLRILQKLQ